MIRIRSAARSLLRTMQESRRSLGELLEQKIHLRALEYFLADTCNLRCSYCAASSPFLSEVNLPSLEAFVETLSFLSRVMRCDRLRLLGGEPLLNKDICGFIRAARQSGIFRNISVTTNGLLLPRMSEEFWQLADVVEISLYASTRDILSRAKLESLNATASRFRTRLEVQSKTQFMGAISDARIEDGRFAQHIFSTCLEAHQWSCHLLYRNRLYRCSRVHTLDRYLSQIGVEHENFTQKDGVIIDGRAGLFADLKKYLESDQPLKACCFCFGTSGPLVETRQLTVQEIRSKWKRSPPGFAPDEPSELVCGARSGG